MKIRDVTVCRTFVRILHRIKTYLQSFLTIKMMSVFSYGLIWLICINVASIATNTGPDNWTLENLHTSQRLTDAIFQIDEVMWASRSVFMDLMPKNVPENTHKDEMENVSHSNPEIKVNVTAPKHISSELITKGIHLKSDVKDILPGLKAENAHSNLSARSFSSSSSSSSSSSEESLKKRGLFGHHKYSRYPHRHSSYPMSQNYGNYEPYPGNYGQQYPGKFGVKYPGKYGRKNQQYPGQYFGQYPGKYQQYGKSHQQYGQYPGKYSQYGQYPGKYSQYGQYPMQNPQYDGQYPMQNQQYGESPYGYTPSYYRDIPKGSNVESPPIIAR